MSRTENVFTHDNAIREAELRVLQLKIAYGGDLNRVNGAIAEKTPPYDFRFTPSVDTIFGMRVAELARSLNRTTDLFIGDDNKPRLVPRSDVNPTYRASHKALEVSGLRAGGFSPAVRMAFETGVHSLLPPNAQLARVLSEERTTLNFVPV